MDRPDIERLADVHRKTWARDNRPVSALICALCGEGWPCLTRRTVDYIVAYEQSHHLMRAEDVNRTFQEGGAWRVAVGRHTDTGTDWLPLNEVCAPASEEPFLADWPNLLVSARPWTGDMPEPPEADATDILVQVAVPPIDSFFDKETGVHLFLSNFYPSPFESSPWQGGPRVLWATVEHYFQAAKCVHGADSQKIRAADTPGKAKRLGRTVDLRESWEEEKVAVMRRALAHKFVAGTELAQMLVDTGDIELIEGNDWGDRFWGVDGTGKNWLGRLLMEHRLLLRTTAT